MIFGRAPDVSYFRIFGCRAWAYNEQGKKWDPKALPMVFLGYESGSKSFRLWNPKSRSIVVSANVKFDETEFPNRPTPAPAPAPPKPTPPKPTPRITPRPPTASSSKTKLPPTTATLPWSFFDSPLSDDEEESEYDSSTDDSSESDTDWPAPQPPSTTALPIEDEEDEDAIARNLPDPPVPPSTSQLQKSDSDNFDPKDLEPKEGEHSDSPDSDSSIDDVKFPTPSNQSSPNPDDFPDKPDIPVPFHWGQTPTYPVGTLRVLCGFWTKVPTHHPVGTL